MDLGTPLAGDAVVAIKTPDDAEVRALQNAVFLHRLMKAAVSCAVRSSWMHSHESAAAGSGDRKGYGTLVVFKVQRGFGELFHDTGKLFSGIRYPRFGQLGGWPWLSPMTGMEGWKLTGGRFSGRDC
ncbi:hypothetical protein E2562_039430 [Oryza meyeriana var. granulata]|uniref:Uncharacterized protein n=1 Tax=Oryza meyeriana var. granulata TaxID=110450 RepID=A0A6G1EUL8_9ORYZ|nr:hypothetical protein E2562_039430 [Oryza meyeriana var. granulata]